MLIYLKTVCGLQVKYFADCDEGVTPFKHATKEQQLEILRTIKQIATEDCGLKVCQDVSNKSFASIGMTGCCRPAVTLLRGWPTFALPTPVTHDLKSQLDGAR